MPLSSKPQTPAQTIQLAESLFQQGNSAQGIQTLEIANARIQLEIADHLNRIYTLLNRLLDQQEAQAARPRPGRPPKTETP